MKEEIEKLEKEIPLLKDALYEKEKRKKEAEQELRSLIESENSN